MKPAAAACETLRLKRLPLDTLRQNVAVISRNCRAFRPQRFAASGHVEIRSANGRSLLASIDIADDPTLIGDHEVGLPEPAFRRLGEPEGADLTLAPARPPASFDHVRRKVAGELLDEKALRAIVRDLVAWRYADIEVAAFLMACASALSAEELLSLTRAMIESGGQLTWPRRPVVDKHCVGGIPGNRTSLAVVPIVAAHGLTIPKTSSRAITSPAGTADTMETLAPVDLDLPAIRRVVEAEGGCIVWGGAVRLSPADDAFVRIEREIDIDAEGQLIASVLSKKVAAGSTHVVIDIPVGPTAKVRTAEAARGLAARLSLVGARLGLKVACLLTDGSQPVGRGIGPAPEARDVLAVLRGEPEAPLDLAERALALSAVLLETGGAAAPGTGADLARAVLSDGRAWARFAAICEAQGGLRQPPDAAQTRAVTAHAAGQVTAIDNRRLARLAKLAGAPGNPAAGLVLAVRVGDTVAKGQPLFHLHAASTGEIAYAFDYWIGAPALTVAE